MEYLFVLYNVKMQYEENTLPAAAAAAIATTVIVAATVFFHSTKIPFSLLLHLTFTKHWLQQREIIITHLKQYGFVVAVYRYD